MARTVRIRILHAVRHRSARRHAQLVALEDDSAFDCLAERLAPLRGGRLLGAGRRAHRDRLVQLRTSRACIDQRPRTRHSRREHRRLVDRAEFAIKAGIPHKLVLVAVHVAVGVIRVAVHVLVVRVGAVSILQQRDTASVLHHVRAASASRGISAAHKRRLCVHALVHCAPPRAVDVARAQPRDGREEAAVSAAVLAQKAAI
mmetsp:Transcript_10775/g.17353  ORF Transcript_10775/g.17353 Transcript_10775/m.17353 type:complete len:202 (+) Transcript_10775:316-921(+)